MRKRIAKNRRMFIGVAILAILGAGVIYTSSQSSGTIISKQENSQPEVSKLDKVQ